ncbi:MAG: proliferating cell nuclear antigen (pcna) [Candidatus Diapherotrites archaeon]|uniref:DNA polymerase sliding clamp n=1 Tax=Candidatus Iainarchaeum sp. TaxID=3101447 RepID=A0A2D6M0D0_9ARCH|nr:proliferating cell nuclear antigen (pcna) [Candidatus Diapherotrites archaeon]|tara:strand:- start:3065 stop:3811 length:747 start_codon:yes stop_codon:yes gene_type:complete
MKLVLEKAVDFQKSIAAISVLIDEAEFILDENALILKATDPSQISMIDFELSKGSFKEYSVESKMKLGMDLDYLNQIMSRAKSTDMLSLELSEDKSRLIVQFKGASTRRFQVPLIDISSVELPNPKIDFDATVKLKAAVLQDALKDAALISSHVSFGVESDKFFVKANSSKGSLENETKKDDKNLIELNASSPASSMFPLDYLRDMLKVPSGDAEVSIKLKSNAPVELSYSIGAASLTYFLAPRIESE